MLLTVSNSLSQYGFTHLAVRSGWRSAISPAPSKRPSGWGWQLANPKTASTLFDGVFSQELTTRLSDSAQCARRRIF